MSRDLTPREIVSELDKHIVGQAEAKRAVAIALRNRWRRARVPAPLKDEIVPKNILLMGPTGCGKTEIARRLARLARAPFIKVEATKFTEVGYVGRDVDSMVRDLAEAAVKMVREEAAERVRDRAVESAEDRLLDLLLPPRTQHREGSVGDVPLVPRASARDRGDASRDKMRELLKSGALDEREVELDVAAAPPPVQILGGGGLEGMPGMQDMASSLQEALGGVLAGKKRHRKKVSVKEARGVLEREEAQRLVDMDAVKQEALERASQDGIVFIDEIDKIAARNGKGGGPDVSREGVQRDILPIIEGSTVTTKYGPLKTDHVLFICAGAFHMSKPQDLIPELQGRLPIRVELSSLTEQDFVHILKDTEASLVLQYQALLATEGVEVSFTDDGLTAIARTAAQVNRQQEDIGARRLSTVLERLLEEVSFGAPDKRASVVVDAAFVDDKLAPLLGREDLSRYIL